MRRQLLLMTALVLVICTARAQLSPGEYVPCQEMPNLIINYNADYRALTRFYQPPANFNNFWGRGGGGDGYMSAEKRARLETLYRDYLAKLDQLDFDGLSQECKVDFILFKRDLNEKLKTSADAASEYGKIKKWFPFADSIYALEKLRLRGHQLDGETVARQWYNMSNEIKAMKPALKAETGLGMESIYQAGLVIADLKRAVAAVYNFYNGYDPMFTWWVPKPYKALDSALTAYGELFKDKNSAFTSPDKSGIVGKPAGREELVRQLKYEMIPYSPEELIDIANKEFAWCDAEMLKASKEMGFGDNWKAALEKVKNTYVPAGKQPEMILDLLNQSVAFLKSHDLITIPPLAEETWGMEMMSPERQLVNPFFLGGSDIIISYPTNTMEEDDKLMSMRGNNPHFSRATVHHELIAGHNLEFFSNERHRTYREFDTPFWTEGWSLYWELLLWDLKFPRGPEDRIGMLFWHMHRCARIIFSLNYHKGKWTPQQCIDFLVDRVGHERANAAGEVRRSFEGHYPPLYQLAYLTGGRQFMALKRELVDGGKMSYKQYHDAVMSLNNMPIEMIRAILVKQPLDKNFSTKWRFYESGAAK